MRHTLETLAIEVQQLRRELKDMRRHIPPTMVRFSGGGGGSGAFNWFQADTRVNLQIPTAGQIPALGYTTSDQHYWVYVTGVAGWVCISHAYVAT